ATSTTAIYTLSYTTLFRSGGHVTARFLYRRSDSCASCCGIGHGCGCGCGCNSGCVIDYAEWSYSWTVIGHASVLVAVHQCQLGVDRKSTRLNSSHVKISYA